MMEMPGNYPLRPAATSPIFQKEENGGGKEPLILIFHDKLNPCNYSAGVTNV
jgi:hypothetical protein